MSIESNFDVSFVAKLTAEEKQIQQNYRPVIGVHKWFARRPGSLFRSLILSEFVEGKLRDKYFSAHDFPTLTIADPFMGGGTTLFEANRIGCNVAGFDINPMAFWVVRQELVSIDRVRLREESEAVISDVAVSVGDLYTTRCVCGRNAAVKYFQWVKQQRCGGCSQDLDLFPGYLIAGNNRHPNFVVHCPGCRSLVEFPELPRGIVACPSCKSEFDWSDGPASKNRYRCNCGHRGKYPVETRADGPPRHRLLGMEYYCDHCRPTHKGRFFKTADKADLRRFSRAEKMFADHKDLVVPDDPIPDGDETKRLHRWGYQYFREMFNDRQLLTLSLLMKRIQDVKHVEARHALATVFSDSLRYQNMLCRYDSYALKCQDIFSIHGFPVGLIQCENNVLGIPGVGSGSFCHFIEKYDRAKEYCEHPFETIRTKRQKRVVPIDGERIDATLVSSSQSLKGGRKALLTSGSITDASFPVGSVDAVFTDPPYFDNVQYAELMDFCYAWLRLLLRDEFPQFRNGSTASLKELTGNETTGKGLEHFTEGLSDVFRRTAAYLKPGAPFVFTYHHNKIDAYVPVVVAVLDAGLSCTATLPSPAEMTASLHINGTGSSVMDTIFVCRAETASNSGIGRAQLQRSLMSDQNALADGECRCAKGDLYCLSLGHIARAVIQHLRKSWDADRPVNVKMREADAKLRQLVETCDLEAVVAEVLEAGSSRPLGKFAQARLFN